MWSLWSSRNDRNHGKSPIPMKLAIDWPLDVCFHLILDAGRDVQMHSPITEVWWQKPSTGLVKVNTDGAFDAEIQMGVTGNDQK
jgi:hypothetical protein